MTSDVTVRLDRISKSFGQFTAVSELSITARDTGTIHLFGGTINADVQNRIGYLPEERGLYRRMKVVDQLRFFAELKNVRGKEVDRKIDEWLARGQVAVGGRQKG